MYMVKLDGLDKVAKLQDIFKVEYADGNLISKGKIGYPAILTGMKVICGNGGKVRPQDEITRAEVVEILGKCDILIKGTEQKKVLLNFTDTNDMTEQQKAMLRHSVKRGFITGYEDMTFKPDKTLTRAEVATILIRYMK